MDLLLSDRLRHLGSLPQQQFNQNLAEAAETIQLAQAVDLKIDPALESSLRTKIAAAPKIEIAYWTAASAIINFSSSPEALEKPHMVYGVCGGMFEGLRSLKGSMLQNCVQVLDGMSFESVTFSNSIIRYNGGPVELKNVAFVNCAFEVTLTREPPSIGQKLTDVLLASNPSNFRID
jgi:hypothetical protein